MRKGNDNGFLFDDKGDMFGVNLGADFTTEHEIGIKKIRESFNIPFEKGPSGIERRKVAKLPVYQGYDKKNNGAILLRKGTTKEGYSYLIFNPHGPDYFKYVEEHGERELSIYNFKINKDVSVGWTEGLNKDLLGEGILAKIVDPECTNAASLKARILQRMKKSVNKKEITLNFSGNIVNRNDLECSYIRGGEVFITMKDKENVPTMKKLFDTCDLKISADFRYNDCQLGTAWDDESFGFIVGKKHQGKLDEIYEAFQKKDIVIMMGGGKGPFSNPGLLLLIASKIPEYFKKTILEGDLDTIELKKADEATGMQSLLRKAGKNWLSLKASWANDSCKEKTKYPVVYWLNPIDQNNNSGWYTVEDLKLWAEGKGPVVKK